MEDKQLEELLQGKIKEAKSGRRRSKALLAVLLLVLLGGLFCLLNYARGRSAPPAASPEATAVAVPTPSPAPTPSPTPRPTPTPSAAPDDRETPSTEEEASVAPTPVPTPGDVPTREAETQVHSLHFMWQAEEDIPVDSVPMRVLYGSTIVAELTLTAEKRWSVSWEDGYSPEQLSLSALMPAGCNATVTRNGDVFVVNCLYDPPAPGEDTSPVERILPQTGLDRAPALLLFAAGVGCLILSSKLARRKA